MLKNKTKIDKAIKRFNQVLLYNFIRKHKDS